MLKRNRSIIVIGLLATLNILLIFRLNSSGGYIDELQQGIVRINNNQVTLKERNKKFASNSETAFLDSGKEIHDFDSLLSINGRPLLVLRIHENNCNDCVHQSLVRITELIEKGNVLPFDMIISTSYKSIDLLRQDFDLRYFSIQQNERIDLELDVTSQPYFFYLDASSIVSKLFVPEYDVMEIFEAYLKSITIKD